MAKFNKGDKVRILGNRVCYNGDYPVYGVTHFHEIGSIGTVIGMSPHYDGNSPVNYDIKVGRMTQYINEGHLGLVERVDDSV